MGRGSLSTTSVVSTVNSSALSAPVKMHPEFATREQASVPTADPSAEPRSGRGVLPTYVCVDQRQLVCSVCSVTMHFEFVTREHACTEGAPACSHWCSRCRASLCYALYVCSHCCSRCRASPSCALYDATGNRYEGERVCTERAPACSHCCFRGQNQSLLLLSMINH